MHHMKTATKRIRLTIAVTPEVHETFQRMAEAGRISISRAMGDWLADTSEAAQFMAETMEKAKKMPSMATGELVGFAEAVQAQAGDILKRMGAHRAPHGADAAPSGTAQAKPGARSPRPVIRGGKSS